MRVHIGSEYRVMDYGDLRIGYTDGGLSFGMGVEYEKFQFDYSYGFSEYSDVLPGVHRISLSFSFGNNRDELYQLAEAEKAVERQLLFEELQREESRRFIAEHTKTADNYFAVGNYLDASVEYQQVLNRDSSNVYALLRVDSSKVLLLDSYKQIQAAVIKDARDRGRAESDSAFVVLHLERGLKLLDQNQFSEALFEFNNALERDPTNPTLKSAIATVNRRKIEESQGKIQQSRVELNNLNYTNALVLLAEARILAANNSSLNQQIAVVEDQIAIQQKINQGISMFQIGEFAKSLEIFDEVLVLDPENEIAQDYQRRSKIETISKDTKMNEAVETEYLRGMEKYQAGNYREAISIWEEILKQEPYNKRILQAIQGAKAKRTQENN
jgi:tetratricopeptide (TPR) repeat protein